jgi:hypothetical protein
MSDRKVICLITGQSVMMGKDYFAKKAEEYGGEDNLKKFYISKKAKSLVKRGYSVNEIRKILSVTEPGLPGEDTESIKDIVAYHSNEKQTTAAKRLESKQNFMMQSSDEDIKLFINNIK